MMGFEWDALRVDEPVLVHAPGAPNGPPEAGTVSMVLMERGRNEVGIQIGIPGTSERRVVWPLAAAVHLTPLVDAATCWRCQP
jgi:hypothetical protein